MEKKRKDSSFIVKIDDNFVEYEYGFSINNKSIDDFAKSIECTLNIKRDYTEMTRITYNQEKEIEKEVKQSPNKVCPNCKIDFKKSYLSDSRAGDFLFDVEIIFCEQCLYVEETCCTNVSR